jgi:hypothetical protein
MSDYADFVAQIKEWQNREDFSDNLVASFVRMAEQDLNAILRVSRMIKSVDGLIAARCAPIPNDWLEFSLVRIACDNVPSGFLPIRYKARDEFFQLPDKWSANFYTIEGRQIFFGGMPDEVEGTTVRMTYYGQVPVFADDVDSWVYTHYPSLYLNAAMMHAYMHAVGEEQNAANLKGLVEDQVSKLNDEWRLAKASGSRLTRTRTRSFG